MHGLTPKRTGHLQVNLPKRYRLSHTSLNSSHPEKQRNVIEPVSKQKKIIINISGQIYETYESTLDKYPETLLGTAPKRSFLYDSNRHQIFLQRHRASFDAILFFYQSSGYLARPSNIPMDEFEEECDYFDIPDNAIRRMKERDCHLYKKKLEIPGYNIYSDFRHMIWKFIEYPKNISSMVYFWFSFVLIVSSIAVFCVENEINAVGVERIRIMNTLKDYVEVTLNIYFAVEFIIRLYTFPYRKQFMANSLNLVELFSTLLFFASFLCTEHFACKLAINSARTLRAFQIARLSRVSLVINTALLVFKSSINDIFAVWFTIFIISILFGSTMYYVEMKEDNTDFTSIPIAMWWALQTILCLGYGDIVPTSVSGKIIGSLMLYYGVVIVMVLVLALGSRFFEMYAKFINMESFLPEDNDDKDYEIHY